jgi:hypothetical protein
MVYYSRSHECAERNNNTSENHHVPISSYVGRLSKYPSVVGVHASKTLNLFLLPTALFKPQLGNPISIHKNLTDTPEPEYSLVLS